MIKVYNKWVYNDKILVLKISQFKTMGFDTHFELTSFTVSHRLIGTGSAFQSMGVAMEKALSL